MGFIYIFHKKTHLPTTFKNFINHEAAKYLMKTMIQEIIGNKIGYKNPIGIKFECHQRSKNFLTRKILSHIDHQTSIPFLQIYQYPNDGCKAIDSLYSGINETSLRVKLRQFFSIFPVLLTSEDIVIVTCRHIFNPTIDVRLLNLLCLCETTIGNLRTQKHATSGTKAEQESH